MELIQINPELQQLISSDQAWYYKIIPKESNTKSITLYTSKTNTSSIVDEVELIFGKQAFFEGVDDDIILKALSKYYRVNERNVSEDNNINHNLDDFLDQIIHEAHDSRSSDIHIEPMKLKCRIRIRIDGKLIERYSIEMNQYPGLLNKIKVKSSLDIAEKRLPQDGRMSFKKNEVFFDIRVSTLPSIHGEKIVLRLLTSNDNNLDINSLGFNENQLKSYLEGLQRSQGIILISGPTGSGKTTTLYATLKILNKKETNILTIEDPIEYTIEGINQVQLKESIGLTFAKALRTFLRQDPDIIMLGEIRDVDTAHMAIRAALTGHLVLSTVHTNSAWGTINRLIDMGVPSYSLADTLVLSVAQRLIRLLCNHCKIKDNEAVEKLLPYYSKPISNVLYKSGGCKLCHYTGYKGRRALYELLFIDKELSQLIKTQSTNSSEYMSQKGVKSISSLAIECLLNGQTSIDEAIPLLLNDN